MDTETLRTKYTALAPALTERSRRLWAATEARALGRGGIERVKQATGLARSTIERGIRDLDSGEPLSPERTRRPGGGRKRATDKDVTLSADLDALVEPTASGDPDSPLRWTSKSVRRLAEELRALGFMWFDPTEPAALARWLAHPDEAVLDRNAEVARAHLSLEAMGDGLRTLLDEAGWLP